MIELNHIGNQVIELVKRVGYFIATERKTFSPTKIEYKGVHDLVSYVDKEAERLLVTELRNILPNSGFITEEKTATHSSEEFIWIIDPLDGTTNFIHNLKPHAISIALMQSEKTILGVVYEIGADEVFYSWQGISVFCNGEPIGVSSNNGISNALISTGFHVNNFERLQNHLKVVSHIVQNSHGIRRHGSAATDLAYLAAGRFDGFFEYGLSVWDVAAGAFLIQQAGGKVSDFSGGQNFEYGREIVAGNPVVYNDLIEIIKKHL